MPALEADKVFEEIMQELPEEIEKMAKEKKALQRGRKIKTVVQLLRIVLMYSGLDKSLRQIAGIISMLYEPITDQSIMERLVGCTDWIKASLGKMLRIEEVGKIEGRRICIVDATDISEPGGKKLLRLHVAMDLINLKFLEIKLTDKHTAESLKHFSFEKSDIVVADRGYCSADAIIEASKKVDTINRVNAHSLPLFDLQSNKIDLAEELKNQPSETILTLPVKIKSKSGKESISGYIHTYRLSQKDAQKARERVLRKQQKNGTKTPQANALFLAEFVIVFTTIDIREISGETILAIYRCRWQIELAFKRWKSLLDLDLLRSKINSPLAELWLWGKLLYALLLQQRADRIFSSNQQFFSNSNRLSCWSLWQALTDQLHFIISGVSFWPIHSWHLFLQFSSPRSRKRKLQSFPVIYHTEVFSYVLAA